MKQYQINSKKAAGAAVSVLCGLFLLSCCSPSYKKMSAAELEAVEYVPLQDAGWEVSTPAAEGIDPAQIARLYGNAADLKSNYGLLVVKNGKLIAEDYFHSSSAARPELVQSVTKSYTSALFGIAMGQGIIGSVDEPMMKYFPDLAGGVADSRKNEITLEQLLQMRAGFPWEESSAELFNVLYSGFHYSTLLKVPLVRDPGSDFDYSNLSSHILAIILTEACGTDLLEFADANLNDKIGIRPAKWTKAWEGYRTGHAELYLTARDMARFGQLYLDRGKFNGEQIIPESWVEKSFGIYSKDAWKYRVGRNFRDIGYGYQWWSIKSGSYRYHLAWGHGGQQIAIIDELDMVIVLTADSLWGQHGSGPWKLEKANLNLIADFIAGLPPADEKGDVK